MEIGQRLRDARLAAGLSQRQLCGDVITRNMLSQIENGQARPSMDTLRYLSARLGKPMSFFLDEKAVTSPNQVLMTQARAAYQEKSYSQCLRLLEDFQEPDDSFVYERHLLTCLSCLALAEEAVAQDRIPYARDLLAQVKNASRKTPYFTSALERQMRLLLSATGDFCLPDDDSELLLRAQKALHEHDPHRAAQYLDAAQLQSGTWHRLRGQAYMDAGHYSQAVPHYLLAYDDSPRECCTALEQCYRELEDYKSAYQYACKLRDLEHI